ncbi:MAG TPA: winged helix-turn-helix domain-containing protein [Paenalcaligenes sp.]|nr:winged helix-turn-helix domain-containing protein [Paenalcaligenes sp.]
MLTQMSPLLYWYTFPEAQADKPSTNQRVQALENSGIQASILHDLMAVYSLAADQLEHSSRTIFILQGVPHQLFASVSRLRTANQNVGIIVLSSSLDEQFMVQLLHSGVDGYALSEASDSLVLALVNNVWRRISNYARLELLQSTPWTLTSRGWVLISPSGQRLDLTTTERQLLTALFSQPGRRADHQTLLSALSDTSQSPQGSGQNRLGVIISRLKKKADARNIEVPLRSVHRWGYMFADEIYIDDDSYVEALEGASTTDDK